MSNSSREYFDQMENEIENNMHDIDRDAEAHGWANAQPNANFDLVVAKDSLVPTVEGFIKTLNEGVDNGELKALEVFAVYKKLEKIFDEAKKKVEENAMIEASREAKTFVIAGVEFTSKQGYAILDYEKDDLYLKYKQQLANRKTLLDNVFKSGDVLFDADGVEVPNVGVKTYSKDSISVKFKTK
jgi:hypothetical protein